MDFYNWHKHPGGPEGPSTEDIVRGEGVRLDKSRFRQIITWGIVNRINTIPSVIPENMTVVNGSLFGKSHHYKMTFWKLRKISPQETERRLAIIEQIGLQKAYEHGLCDRGGKLQRTHRSITI